MKGCPLSTSQPRQVSAIDIQNLSRDVGGRVRAEKYGGAFQIVEPTESALGNLLEHGALPLLVLVKGFGERRSKVARTDAVHANALGRPLGSERSGQAGKT